MLSFSRVAVPVDRMAMAGVADPSLNSLFSMRWLSFPVPAGSAASNKMVPRWSGWGCYLRSCNTLPHHFGIIDKTNSGQGGGLGVHNGQRPGGSCAVLPAIDTDIPCAIEYDQMIACSADQRCGRCRWANGQCIGGACCRMVINGQRKVSDAWYRLSINSKQPHW